MTSSLKFSMFQGWVFTSNTISDLLMVVAPAYYKNHKNNDNDSIKEGNRKQQELTAMISSGLAGWVAALAELP